MMLEQIVRESFTGDSIEVEVTVIIEDAYKEFSATPAQEKESVYALVSVGVWHSDTGANVRGTGEANFSRTSADAKDKAFEELYRLNLKNALWAGLKETQAYLAKHPIK